MAAQILINLTADTTRRVFADEDFARLADLGETERFDPKIDADPAAYAARLARADAMLTCWGSRPVRAEDLALRPAGAKPLLVAHAAGSVRGIVSREVLETGRVRLTQGAPAIAKAVAQYTVGLIVLALRQAAARRDALRAGERVTAPYHDLEGIPVGLIGLSRVGAMVPALLAPFEAKVLAYDPYFPADRAAALGVELVPDLDALLARARVVSLHTPVTSETRGMLNAERVARLAPGTVVVNTARADIVDQEALFARALRGEITYYTDVTQPEPLPADHPAHRSPSVFITPHIAGPTQQSLRRMSLHSLSEIGRFLRGEPLTAEVTPDRYDLLA